MANYPCQDCKKYMEKYDIDFGSCHQQRMRRTCAEYGVVCVHQLNATPCKRSNCAYWDHTSSVNGISWCTMAQPYIDTRTGEVVYTCMAVMIPESFDQWTPDELKLIEDGILGNGMDIDND